MRTPPPSLPSTASRLWRGVVTGMTDPLRVVRCVRLVTDRSIQWEDDDVPLYSGFVSDAYPGSGQNLYLPPSKAEWDELLVKLIVSTPLPSTPHCNHRTRGSRIGVSGLVVAVGVATQDNNWVDMNTRLVIFEMVVYNPGLNLVGIARLGVEFLASGTVLPTYVPLSRCHGTTRIDASLIHPSPFPVAHVYQVPTADADASVRPA